MKHSHMKSHSVGLELFINKETCNNEMYKSLKNIVRKISYFHQ
jgi:hypothetical protein